MRRGIIRAAIAAVSILCGNTVLAGESAQKFFDDCIAKTSYGDGYCLGFIAGIASVSVMKPNLSAICIPDGTKIGDLKRDVLVSMKNSGVFVRALVSADVAVILALIEIFPCRR